MQFYVYIMSNKKNGTLYTGMISNLIQRVRQRKNKVIPSFTQRYHLNKLVYYEVHEIAESTAQREKR